ncbi:MAG: class I SAM-dependent methyltransferase [candidate division NC10 bacterium]|nr:class I SAM-dependent methyltransferase [candidate division NC10 bacterium]
MDSRSKDRVRQQYSRQAHLYAKSRPHAWGDTLELMARWAACQGTESVLDVACGCGFSAFALAPVAAKVTAIDITPRMLEEASRLAEQRGLSNIEFQEADAEALPFPDGHFHLVSCRISAHHFSSPPAFLSESWRVLIPGGALLLADTSSPEELELSHWHNETERLRDPSHVQNFTPSQWREMVLRAGFQIAEFSSEYRSHLEFSDWVRTSGCSPETISMLLQRFEQAPPEVKRAFQIQRRGDQIAFSWPITALKAIKP